MTGNLISEKLLKTLATAKEHLDQEYQNLQSIKEKLDSDILLDI